MKKIFVLFLIIVLASGIFFLTQTPKVEDNSNILETNTLVHSLDTHLKKSKKDDLDKITERKYIRVLTTLNKTNFYLLDGNLFGYEYSLLKKYENYLNKNISRNNLKTAMEFIPVSRNELIPMLNQGYGDIAAAGLTITPQRKEEIDFTTPYLSGIKEVVVTPKNKALLENKYELSGKKVWVRKSSSYYESLLLLNSELENMKRKKVRIITIDENVETEQILEMVNSGAVTATIADSHIAEIWSEVLENIQIHEKIILRKNSQIAWAVRKNNPELKKSLNSFLKQHKQGSLIGNIFFNRYYKDSEKLKNPGELENWENLNTYKNYIKKYSSKYNFDWLLIMAIAFQESGFDNSKTSHKGAVGVMQILPSTAGDKNINIKEVTKPENNIHAGVKYLDFIRNRYFSDPEIDENDQIRLTLAAYNAGPAKIRQARKQADKMGLDPNKWFRNVEIGVLKTIGNEPVEYVSNINRYYLLYNNIFSEHSK
ncbi:MAG: lytic transglycosylase F [Desulforegulaceae bacterium]|nr:lytic transglycosylase F [Desulforegulaceae bacterium]